MSLLLGRAAGAFPIEEANGAAVAGSALGLAPFIRISFATAMERLRLASDRSAACSKDS